MIRAKKPRTNINNTTQTPQNQFSENTAAFKENRRSFQPIHSPGISNEYLEHQTEDEWTCPG